MVCNLGYTRCVMISYGCCAVILVTPINLYLMCWAISIQTHSNINLHEKLDSLLCAQFGLLCVLSWFISDKVTVTHKSIQPFGSTFSTFVSATHEFLTSIWLTQLHSIIKLCVYMCCFSIMHQESSLHTFVVATACFHGVTWSWMFNKFHMLNDCWHWQFWSMQWHFQNMHASCM